MKNQLSKTIAICLLFVLTFSALILSGCNKEDNLVQNQAGSENTVQLISSDKNEPDVPYDLEVPAGNHLINHVYAKGVQIYRCTAGPGDTRVWTFVAPDAKLYANAFYDGLIGTHYAGPIWESNSGSKVKGAVDKIVPSPDPNAVPWLLLHSVLSDGPGIYNGVTYIQRVNTTGGKAPATVSDTIGAEIRVPYTAEYYFYKRN